jgi:hypothetical protein
MVFSTWVSKEDSFDATEAIPPEHILLPMQK